jgi:glycosyltransferase involved in cell wall biosynthesis
LRIAIDATYGVGRQLTGVGVYSRELIAALMRSDNDAQWRLCFRPHRVLRGLLNIGGVRTRIVSDTHVPPCDLFHGLNQRLPTAKIARKIVTFHDLFVLTGEYSTPEFRARFSEQARAAAARADLIIAVSRFTGDQVRDLLGVPEARIRVIHHGTKPPPHHDNPARREPMILHVGAIQKRKNIVRLVEAFEHTGSEWRLVLAGSQGYGAEEIAARIARSRRRTDITVTGYISARELEALYRRAGIFAFPSLDEGFGMPVLDAMAQGLPVLTSTTSALREVAGNAAVLVDPQRTDEITAALLRLCDDSELRGHLAALGRARAATFTWDVAAEKTWIAYRELLG